MIQSSRWLCALGVVLAGCVTHSPTTGLRLNQIQVIGTHNSYHQRTFDSLMKLIAMTKPDGARDLDYNHRPLPEQFSRLGIRQIELDCYADPEGGRFAHPVGIKRAAELGMPPVPNYDPEGKLLKPGIKVIHIPDIDFNSSVLTFVDGLKQVRQWSLANPRHLPIFILIELKDDNLGPGYTQALPWRGPELAALETEILSVFPPGEVIKPDDVRGTAKTLPEALDAHGWPVIETVRGKVMFGLDNEGPERTAYLEGHPALEGKLIFVSVPPNNPAAAWMKRNDPIKGFDDIQNLVRAGFMVRTRADEPTHQVRINDTRMRDHALASGAQFISTDYPEPDLRFSPYRVGFEGGAVARQNPVSGPAEVRLMKIE